MALELIGEASAAKALRKALAMVATEVIKIRGTQGLLACKGQEAHGS